MKSVPSLPLLATESVCNFNIRCVMSSVVMSSVVMLCYTVTRNERCVINVCNVG